MPKTEKIWTYTVGCVPGDTMKLLLNCVTLGVGVIPTRVLGLPRSIEID